MAKVAKDPELKQYQGDSGLVNRWLKEIELVQESNEQQQFEIHADRIYRKYKNSTQMANFDPAQAPKVEFNVLWSNIQVLRPALFSRIPKTVAQRYHKDHDPVGLMAARIAERATQFNLDRQQDKFFYHVALCVDDRLLAGRGQGQIVYRVEFEDAVDSEGNPLVDKEGNPIKRVKPNSERVDFEHVNVNDYLESKARTQYEVRWRNRTMYYTYQDAVEEFGEECANEIDYSANPYQKKKKNEDNTPDFLEQAKVYKIEDLTTKEVLYISPGYRQKPLKKAKDPLKLNDFYSFPVPLVATTTADSTYPTADFIIYESLANELDYAVQRLGAMTDCIRLVGMVASQHNKDISEMLRLADGNLKPITGWQTFIDKGGISAMVSWLPFDMAVNAIPVLEQRVNNLKAQIDEITSMPDIVRGSSDPNDPVYTQQQKSHWTVLKLMRKQQDVQRFCREIIAKMAEVIFEPGFFSDETIRLMAGVDQMKPEEQQLFWPALQLLRDDRLRTFRIDIETDSTITQDDKANMEAWARYLEGLNVIFSSVGNLRQFAPEMLKPAVETAIDAVRQLRFAKGTEGAFEKALEEMEANDKAAKENPQPPPPDAALLRAQVEQQKAQMQAQKDQADFQLKQQELMMQGQQDQFTQFIEQQKLQLESMKIEGELAVKHEANQIDAQEQLTRGQIDKIIADMDIFQAELKNKLEAQKVEVQAALGMAKLQTDKEIRASEVAEKVMEEQRLSKDQVIKAAQVRQKDKEIDVWEKIETKKAAASKNKTMQKTQKPQNQT